MTKEQKVKEIKNISKTLDSSNVIYLADLAGLNSVKTQDLRLSCYSKNVKLEVVKNSLLKIAMDNNEKDFGDLYSALKQNTAIMISDVPNLPAKILKDLRGKGDIPLLKGAWIDNNVYLGDNMLDSLVAIKSKNELIADIVSLLGTPIRNVISALSNREDKTE